MNGFAAIAVVSGLVSAVPQSVAPVRLDAFQCATVSDRDVRPLLQVELRDRLLDGTAAAPTDFVLVSIGCEGDTANVLAVRQAGGPATRRRVPLDGVGADARARNVAVAIAELLRVEPAPPPSAPVPPPEPAIITTDDEPPDDERRAPARLELVEPLILLPLTAGGRAGVRTRLANTDVPNGIDTPNFYLLSIEPFIDFGLNRGVVASVTLPVTWTEGPAVSSWGRLANLTAAIRYASGERLRVGVGAAVSLNVGQAPAAQAESNLFELDRFRDGTDALRLQADALWRSGRLYLQGEAALLLLADQHRIGTLLRAGLAGGIALSHAVVGAEYVVLSDAFDDSFITGDRFVQKLIVGTRWALSPATTLGVHLQLALDQGPNLGAAGTLSAAWSL